MRNINIKISTIPISNFNKLCGMLLATLVTEIRNESEPPFCKAVAHQPFRYENNIWIIRAKMVSL
jgi:hypothetical protein